MNADREGDLSPYAALWALHTRRLVSLVDTLGDRMPPHDLAEGRHLVQNNEFGLAFTFLAGSIGEHRVRLDPAEADLVEALAAELDEDQVWVKVRRGGAEHRSTVAPAAPDRPPDVPEAP